MMSLANIMNELFKNEPWVDVNTFFDNYETLEEIPLVSRYRKIPSIITSTGREDIAEFLASTSFFVLSWAMLFARNKDINLNNRFIALSYTDFDFSNPQEPPIPNFFIHSTETKMEFLNRLKSHQHINSSQELKSIKKLFRSCKIESALNFYESRFYDEACNEELVRVYAVPR
jgi:Immunity protein 15